MPTTRPRRSAVLALSAAAALVLSACSSDEPEAAPSAGAPAGGTVVMMPLTQFSPTSVTVKAGETLTWENSNDIGHTIVQGTYAVDGNGQRTSETDDGTYRLDVAKKGDRVSHTFSTAGTFQFFCTIHKAMNGTVTVA